MLSSYILKAWAGGRAAASKGASGSIASARMLQSVVEPRPSAAATHPAHQPPSLSRVFRKNEGGGRVASDKNFLLSGVVAVCDFAAAPSIQYRTGRQQPFWDHARSRE